MTSKQREYVQKFRKCNPRIDYAPMPDAFAAITKAQQLYPSFNRREILDILVEKGLQAIEREGSKTPAPN